MKNSITIKRFAAAGLTLAMLLSGLTACGKKDDAPAAHTAIEVAEAVPVVENAAQEAAPEATPIAGSGGSILGLHAGEAQETNDEIVREGFHDFRCISKAFDKDRALYNCEDSDGQWYYVCVNKSGQVVFYFEQDSVWHEPEIVDGYTYYKHGDILYVVDTDGNLCSVQAEDVDHKIESYGGGYVLIREAAIGFDASEIHFILYGPDGAMIAKLGESEIIHQLFGSADDWLDCLVYYGEDVDAWLDDGWDVDAWQHLMYDYGLAGLDYFKYDTVDGVFRAIFTWDSDDEHPHYLTLTTEGTLLRQTYEEVVRQGQEIVRDSTARQWKYCDYTTGETNIMPDSYFDKSSGNGKLDGDRIAMELIGDDENPYVALFDTQWNLIMEPTRNYGTGFSFAEDRLILCSDDGECTVYDENGNFVFNFSSYGFRDYSDGVLLLDNGSVIDKDGNTLFTNDTIDASNARNITAEFTMD